MRFCNPYSHRYNKHNKHEKKNLQTKKKFRNSRHAPQCTKQFANAQ